MLAPHVRCPDLDDDERSAPIGALEPAAPVRAVGSGSAVGIGGRFTCCTGVTSDRAALESLYATDPDPWHGDRSWFEERKRDLTLAALPRQRYHRAVEPGCANGALTARLAERCDELYAFDVVGAAVERATERVADHRHVHVLAAAFPDYWPHQSGDLVVWSDVANYLTDVGWDLALRGLDRWLEPGGSLVVVHRATDPDVGIRARIRRLDETEFLERVSALVDDSVELGVWTRRPWTLL